MSRQLALFAPSSADEDGDQLDLIEAAGTERVGPSTVRVPRRRCFCGRPVPARYPAGVTECAEHYDGPL